VYKNVASTGCEDSEGVNDYHTVTTTAHPRNIDYYRDVIVG